MDIGYLVSFIRIADLLIRILLSYISTHSTIEQIDHKNISIICWMDWNPFFIFPIPGNLKHLDDRIVNAVAISYPIACNLISWQAMWPILYNISEGTWHTQKNQHRARSVRRTKKMAACKMEVMRNLLTNRRKRLSENRGAQTLIHTHTHILKLEN